jgi:hypothetical protein
MVRWWVLVHCGYFLPVFLGYQLELWILWETLTGYCFIHKKFIETWNWDSLILKILKKPKPEVMTKSKNCPTQVITSIAQLWSHDRFWS